MHRYLALLLFLLTAPSVLAQPQGMMGGAISGRVLDDAAGTALPSATVALYLMPDTSFVTGAATDADGAFLIERLRPGTYQVRVSVVGYATVREEAAVRPGAPVDLGEIRLLESAVQLGEASVEAEREFITQRADRTIYDVANQPVTAGENVLEALKTLPSVEVDQDDNISLRGGRNVAIQVNGRSVPVNGQFLAAYLRQIGSDNVERIEVIPNPSARYEPDGLSGIINIVLKENAPDRGLSGGLTLGGGTRPEANINGNLAYQKGKFDTYGSYGFFYNRFGFDGITDRDYLGTTSPLVSLDNVQDGDRTFSSNFGNVTVDYTPAQGTTLSLNGSLSARNGDNENAQTITTLFRDEGRLTEAERTTDGISDGLNATGTLAFQRRFNEDGTHDLSIELRASSNTDTNDDLYTQTLNGISGLSSYFEESARTENWAQLDYTRPLPGNVRLETGAKATWETIANDVRFGEGGPDGLGVTTTDGFDYDRSIYAAYLQAAVPLGAKFEAQAGVRAESAERAFTIDSENTDNAFDYVSLFPSAFLIYNLQPGTSIKGSYSRRINRPSPWSLSPFSSLEDPTVTRQGNPNLRPEYTDSYEATFQYKFFLTLTPFYRRTTDVIARRFLVVDDRTIFTSDNFAVEQSYGTDLTLAAGIPGTSVRGFISGSLFRSETDGGEIDPSIDFGVTSWSARASLQAKITESTSAQFFGFFRGPRAIQSGRSSGFGFTSVGLQQKLRGDELTLGIRANDPLGIAKFEFESQNDIYTELGIREPAQRSISATLTWTFGERSQRRRQQQQGPGQQGGGDDGGIGI